MKLALNAQNYVITFRTRPYLVFKCLSAMPKPSTSSEELPVTKVKSQMCAILKEEKKLIILGETGSGKSTQIPQYAYECGLAAEGSMIAVTQPRRVAAVTLAQRVAQEMGQQLGQLVGTPHMDIMFRPNRNLMFHVGYNVRFDACCSDQSRLLYMTDGILLREAIHDRWLRRYSVIVLDEAHERTLHTDVLFGIVKRAQRLREVKVTKGLPNWQSLKVIIMSATMDADLLAKFFDRAPVYFVEGRLHPIELFYSADEQSDYQHSALVTIFQIHKNEKPGTILVFLTGQEEIESMQRKIRDLAHDLPTGLDKIEVLPLYAALNTSQQARIFTPVKPHTRRVIVATNIAETSVTIPDVAHVVDCGKVKCRLYDAPSGMNQLRVVNVSKAQACQRTGRAGRNQPGQCYRLYTEAQYNQLDDNATPEILRCSLTSIVLDLLSWKADVDLLAFDFISKPADEAIQAAIKELCTLGAVEEREELTDEGQRVKRHKLTAIGEKMAAFPIDPKYSRMIVLAATKLTCLKEILQIIAVMTHENVFINHSINREDAQSAHSKFRDDSGDHLQMLNVFVSYTRQLGCDSIAAATPEALSKAKKWCQENFIQANNMQTAVKIYNQLKDICSKNDLPMNAIPAHPDVVKQALCYGLFANAAELDTTDCKHLHYKVLSSGVKAKVHPSSQLHGRNPGVVIFSELVFTSTLYMRDVTSVQKAWLQEVILSKKESQPETNAA